MRFSEFLRENARWLGAGALLAFLSSFGQTFFISIFAGEIRSEFGLSHGEWGGIYSLGTTSSAVVMIWAGALTDRFRARALGVIVLSMLIAACLAMSAVSSVWVLPFVIFALRFTGQGMISHISVVAMSRWFIAARGRALAIASLGFAFGEAFLPVVFVAALGAGAGWRGLWIVATTIAAIGIPLLILLLRHERTPQSIVRESPVAGMMNRHWTRREALNHWLFWLMVPALLGPSAFNTAFFFQQVRFAEIKGWEHLDLVALFPVYSVTVVGISILSGWALDKMGTARIMPFYQFPMVLGFITFSLAMEPGWLVPGLMFLAATTGANATLPNSFWAEFFGTRNLGSIKAMAAAVMVFGSAVGPGLTGLLIDMGVGLETQYLGVAIFFLFSSALMWVGIRRASRLLGAAEKSAGAQ